MTRERVLGDLKARFGNDIIDFHDKSPKRVYLEVRPESLLAVAGYIFRDLQARFNIASGIDARTHLEILYHFSLETIDLLVSLRVKLDKQQARVASLAPMFKGAAWIEREMQELLGIQFQGHPDPRRLLLDKEWPEGVYPLRREYREWDKRAVRDRGV